MQRVLLLLPLILGIFAEPIIKEAPCDYKDTVDLTGSKQFQNGSYVFDDIILPENLTGTYEYKIHIANEKSAVELHVRGCICQLRPCISLCCPAHQEFRKGTCLDSEKKINSDVNITTKQGYVITTNMFQKFAIQFGRPCKEMFHLIPHINDYDNYSLFENGSIFRMDDGLHMTKDEYCMSPLFDEHIQENILVPVNCFSVPKTDIKYTLNGVALLISAPFMILTLIVYLSIPELRTLHGLSFCCYLAGLSIGYLILAYLIFGQIDQISDFNCRVLGYTAYFAFISAFLWLNVISFDLFYSTNASRSINEIKRFQLYCVYAWGMALMLLLCVITADNSSWVSKSFKAGVGFDSCYINTKDGWSALIYFYGPLIIIISFNTVMFVLTALQIKRGMTLVTSNNTRKPYDTKRDIFMIYIRLFILMGIVWLAEILSYFFENSSMFGILFDITDFLNAIQGIAIFILFVLRKTVRQLVLKTFYYDQFGRKDGMTVGQTEEMTEHL